MILDNNYKHYYVYGTFPMISGSENWWKYEKILVLGFMIITENSRE